jgi:hypothetical protein
MHYYLKSELDTLNELIKEHPALYGIDLSHPSVRVASRICENGVSIFDLTDLEDVGERSVIRFWKSLSEKNFYDSVIDEYGDVRSMQNLMEAVSRSFARVDLSNGDIGPIAEIVKRHEKEESKLANPEQKTDAVESDSGEIAVSQIPLN